MSQTSLLPPITAVRIVWARTGSFSNDEHSGQSAALVEAALKEIKDRAEKDENERRYVTSAISTMDASLRNLDMIYKGRQLNFQENEQLRTAYLDSVNENLDFGNKAKDILKSLPAMSIGGAGSVTIAQYFNLSGIQLWGVGLALAGLGYIINLLIVKKMRRSKQMLYVRQDYERGLYYDQYLTRVATTLTSLYLDLDRIHKNVFGQSYPVDVDVKVIVKEMLEGVRSTFCDYIHKHINEKKITPELWSLCETGKATENCPFWEGRKH
ncbi:MAG: hypothetical protein FJ264_16470 [Planctomycetes bacterium]|nr:hypothetical protein [Planctomycetota bacterium]